MASRKPPRKKTPSTGRLVPTLRDAVGVLDRALEELGRAGGDKAKRAPRAKRPRPRKA
jgi:hypothetical protein